ncbi:MAG: DUF4974 domain-containing protein [Duncaniella sp.]|nr:DUF4974 domain-containing protein [Duncaniella sp.]
MDKYDIVLDIIEHPERYTSDRLGEILSDPETREVYNLLCKADSAMRSGREVDVDAEWEEFRKGKTLRSHKASAWFGNRAALIAAIAGTSAAAVAAGIAVTVAVVNRTTAGEQALPSAKEDIAAEVAVDTVATLADTVKVDLSPVMFEDASLDVIMETIASVYNVEVKFANPETASLHLYYKFEPTLPLEEIVSRLNTFEQINIRLEAGTLVID